MNNKKRRLLTILLFPLFGTLFLIGYMLSYYGEKTGRSKRAQNKPKSSAPMYDFEIQIVEKEEKQTIVH
jgi:hypothetical protein